MKKLLIFLITLLLFSGIVSTTTAKNKKQEKQLYTAYNIWVLKEANMKCINFKTGKRIIPAGTPVSHVRKVYIIDQTGMEHTVRGAASGYNYHEKIRFRVEGQRRRVRIGYESRYHRGTKIEEYIPRMFTEKTFEEQTVGMTEMEITAIKNGVLVEGMSKKAVLMSYGYPPEHKTPSLDDPDWYYWMNKREVKKICFNENKRTVRCEKRIKTKTNKIEDTL